MMISALVFIKRRHRIGIGGGSYAAAAIVSRASSSDAPCPLTVHAGAGEQLLAPRHAEDEPVPAASRIGGPPAFTATSLSVAGQARRDG